MEGFTLKVDHLENENSKLQNLFQEKSNVNENIRQELSRLSSENSVRTCLLGHIHFLGIDGVRNMLPFVLSLLCNVTHR